ncbi:hypothetical protein J4Q44_G00214030 [Coregonus suidteri]|uniref:Uncharacterized protein n=1 Tax=Coregonus suidteri TaxID=861788 RepID=A0AAN8L9X2_9TELE
MRKKQMSSRVSNLKRRKEKCTRASSDLNLKVKSSDKSSVKRMDVKKTKLEDSKTEMPLNDCMVGGCRASTTTSEKLSCDGYKWDEKTRCGAPPDMDELWEVTRFFLWKSSSETWKLYRIVHGDLQPPRPSAGGSTGDDSTTPKRTVMKKRATQTCSKMT